MKASETKLARLVEGTNQYLIPHFQRPYTWNRSEWKTLWSDLQDVLKLPGSSDTDHSSEHFIGSVVTMPGHSVPEGVTKYLLIDGQQRLTTISVLLAAIRDRARLIEAKKLAEKIHDLYLTNRYEEGVERFKLLPSTGESPETDDRSAYVAIAEQSELAGHRGNKIVKSYKFFAKMLSQDYEEDLEALQLAVTNRLILVSIVLHKDDNPYAIFESLNAKGQPLSQADLIRNYFFMCLPVERHEQVHKEKWKPMEATIGGDMTEFIRHYLMRTGTFVRQKDVYNTLRGRVEDLGREMAEELLDDLVRFAPYYARLLQPDREDRAAIAKALRRLNRLQATVAYPLFLDLFDANAQGDIGDSSLEKILAIVENFLLRRYVCGRIRAELNRIFPSVFHGARKYSSIEEGVSDLLAARNYPSDGEFLLNLQQQPLYGQGERKERARFILESLERATGHKETVELGRLTIEHIMPQTLTDNWRDYLGEENKEEYELLVHTLGNLTLTGYNSELATKSFPRKKELLVESKVGLNQYFIQLEEWGFAEIKQRGEALAKKALEVWPYFGSKHGSHDFRPTGTTPSKLVIWGQEFEVSTWQDVVRITLETVIDLHDDSVTKDILRRYSKYINQKDDSMRRPKILPSGLFYESHLNAEQIYQLCLNVVQTAGMSLSADEWSVEAS